MVNPGLVITAPGQITQTDLGLPLPGRGQVRIRVLYVALCGSDRKLYDGSYSAPHTYPIVIGHEWVGEIDAVGAACAKPWSTGDVITGDCSIYCGTCLSCTTDRRNYCAFIQKRGITIDGACAKYIVADERHVYRCPAGFDPLPFVLAEPMAVSAHALLDRLSRDDLKRVRRALVIGAGGIGALSLFVLTECRVPHITIVDMSAPKVATVASLRLPGVHAIDSDLSDLEDGSFDLILEASGSGLALRRAIELSAPRGNIVCVGHQTSLEVDFGLVVSKSLTISASLGSTGGFENAIQAIAAHRTTVPRIVTRVVPFEEAERCFRDDSRNSADLKVVIRVGEAGAEPGLTGVA